MNEEITPEESLLLIARTIEETKKRFAENGHIIILWGSLTFLVFLSQYILVLVGLYKVFDIAWTCAAFPLGAVYTALYYRRKVKSRNLPKTVIGSIIMTMSWVIGANLMILGFVFGHQLGRVIAPVFLILLALNIMLIGVSVKFKPMTIGGVVLNLMGFAAFSINGEYHGLLMSLGAVIAMIIPGILLNKANRKEHV